MAQNENKILLHACCAICSGYPISLLKEMGYSPIVYFYNPNLDSEEEFNKRLEAQSILCKHFDVKLIVEPYEPKEYYREYEILKEKFKSIDNTDHTWFSKEAKGCIDSFFYSKHLQLLKQETIKTDVSDHYPVYAEFLI